jgi:monoamine oxidase
MEVAIIGAGMAGLAAARVLRAHGIAFEIFEATGRIGGRARSVDEHATVIPIELGPEFIHGRPDATFTLLRAARLATDPIPDLHHHCHQRRLEPIDDIWTKFGKALAPATRQPRDESARDFLGHRELSEQDRKLFAMLVEGFYAAPLDDISIKSIASDESGAAGDESTQKRLRGGYGRLVGWFGDQLHGTPIHYDCAVSAIDWTGNSIRIEHTRGESLADIAIVTLPIGVLKSGAVTLRPGLGDRARSLEQLAMGQVVKLVMCLDEPVWREHVPRELEFVHGGDTGFPTYWVRSSFDAHVLTAWAGGPHAIVLRGCGLDELVARALDGFAKVLGMRVTQLTSTLRHRHFHDWDTDPFALGAYSYTRVGGGSAAAELARPFDGRVFLAGEAMDADYEGTVAGALASGTRAAQQIVARAIRSAG